MRVSSFGARASCAGRRMLAAGNALELDIVRLLLRDRPYLHNEHVLSGPGLMNLHRCLCELRGASPVHADAGVLVAAAASDALARETLETFCGWLGSLALLALSQLASQESASQADLQTWEGASFVPPTPRRAALPPQLSQAQGSCSKVAGPGGQGLRQPILMDQKSPKWQMLLPLGESRGGPSQGSG